MNKINIKINIKDPKVYIPLIIISVLLMIVALFGISSLVNKLASGKKYTSSANEVEFIDRLGEDKNRIRKEIAVKTDKIKDENNEEIGIPRDCTSKNICVSKVVVLCYEDRGVIEYTVVNNSSQNIPGGYLNLTVGNYSAVIWYDALNDKASVEGFHAYDGYNLKDTENINYSVRDMDDTDKSSIASFMYYSCKSPRVYYPLNYEGQRIYRDGDIDFKQGKCVFKNNLESVNDNVAYYVDPCKNSSLPSGVKDAGECQITSDCVEDANGECHFNINGGNNSNNSCVKFTVIEDTGEKDGNGNPIEERRTYCGRKDASDNITSGRRTELIRRNELDENGNVRVDKNNKPIVIEVEEEVYFSGSAKCQSTTFCLEDGSCHPFCEDINFVER